MPLYHPNLTEIRWAVGSGIITACQGGTTAFCPDSGLLRSEAAAGVIRLKYGESFSYTTTQYFTDVPPTHPAFKYIMRLWDDKITTGCADQLFCPDGNALRGQIAVFIVRAKYGDNFTYGSTPYFTDVPDTHPYFKYVQKMYEDGNTDGCPQPGTFCVDDPCTRAQFAVFLYRAKPL